VTGMIVARIATLLWHSNAKSTPNTNSNKNSGLSFNRIIPNTILIFAITQFYADYISFNSQMLPIMTVIKEVPFYVCFQTACLRSIKFIKVSWFQLSHFRKNIFQSTYTVDGAAEQKLRQWPASQRNGYAI
jgi:hypothetical protein